MDSWGLFVILSLALSAALSFRSANSSRSLDRGLDAGFLAGYGLFLAGALLTTIPRDELGLGLIAAAIGLPVFLVVSFAGAVVGRILRTP